MLNLNNFSTISPILDFKVSLDRSRQDLHIYNINKLIYHYAIRLTCLINAYFQAILFKRKVCSKFIFACGYLFDPMGST